MIQPKHILLVEDDEDDQMFFSQAINEIDNSINLHLAGNGLEALATLHEMPVMPDIIFVDINMPSMNGLEFLWQLKSIISLKNIPVVVLTTTNSFAEEKLSLTLGASLFLTKPSFYPELKQNIKAALQYNNVQPKNHTLLS